MLCSTGSTISFDLAFRDFEGKIGGLAASRPPPSVVASFTVVVALQLGQGLVLTLMQIPSCDLTGFSGKFCFELGGMS